MNDPIKAAEERAIKPEEAIDSQKITFPVGTRVATAPGALHPCGVLLRAGDKQFQWYPFWGERGWEKISVIAFGSIEDCVRKAMSVGFVVSVLPSGIDSLASAATVITQESMGIAEKTAEKTTTDALVLEGGAAEAASDVEIKEEPVEDLEDTDLFDEDDEEIFDEEDDGFDDDDLDEEVEYEEDDEDFDDEEDD